MVVGPLDVQYVRDMWIEHNAPEAQDEFVAWNAGHTIKTTAVQEWRFVLGPEGIDVDRWVVDVDKALPLVTQEQMVSGRNSKRLKDLLQVTSAVEARLLPIEVAALRMYSGPMYVKYNAVLRGQAKGKMRFTATMHVLASALRKLARCTLPPPGGVVYRGNADLALPEWFLLPDEQGLLGGGVEWAFMSTTPNRTVALGYAMAYRHTQELPTLFEIEVGKTSVGADISPFSQFEEEKEFLYPPLTYLELVSEARLSADKQVSVLKMQLTINQKGKTLEQAELVRKLFLRNLALQLSDEVKRGLLLRDCNVGTLGEVGSVQRLEQLHAHLYSIVEEATPASLNNNEGYSAVFQRLMDASEKKRAELVSDIWQFGVGRSRAVASKGRAVCQFAHDLTGQLCEDSLEVRERLLAMRHELAHLSHGSVDRREEAHAKIRLGDSLRDQGAQLPSPWTGPSNGKLSDTSKEALKYYHEAVEMDASVAPMVYGKISGVYQQNGMYGQALDYNDLAMKLYTASEGRFSRDVAALLGNKATMLKNIGKNSEALELLYQAVHIQKSMHGEDHQDVACDMNNIASTHMNLGQYDAALEHYNKALAIWIKTGHGNSVGAGQVYNNKAGAHAQLGQMQEAAHTMCKAVAIFSKIYGSTSLQAQGARCQRACFLAISGEKQEARTIFELAIPEMISAYGRGHPTVQHALSQQAQIQSMDL